MQIKDLVKKTIELSGKITNSNIKLKVKDRSILSALIESDGVTTLPIDISYPNGVIDYIEALDKQVTNQTNNGEVFAAIVTKLSKLVSNEIAFIKNIVVRDIDDMRNTINDKVTFLNDVGVARDYSIELVGRPIPLQHPNMLIDINTYRDDDFTKPIDKMTFNNVRSKDDVIQLFMTGISMLDNDIVNWINSQDSDFIMNVWGDYFKNIYPNKETYNILMNKQDINEVLAVYLISRHLLINVQEDTRVSLIQYRIIISDIKKYAANMINYLIKKFIKYDEIDQVVIKYEPQYKKIYVYQDAYQRWLTEENNTPEVLLGALIAGKDHNHTRTVSAINANSEFFKNKWSEFIRFSQVKLQNNIKDQLKTMYVAKFKEIGRNAYHNNYLNIKEIPNFLISAEKDVIKYLNSKKKDELTEVVAISEHLITAILYKNSNANSFISYMNEVKSGNNNLEPSECAYYATMKLIIDYLITQIEKSK